MWATDYFKEVIGMSVNEVHVSFGLIGVSGPIIGAIFSGIIASKLGGY